MSTRWRRDLWHHTSHFTILGLRRPSDLIGIRRSRLHRVMQDIVIALLVLLVMGTIGNLSNKWFGPDQHDTAVYRSMAVHNSREALAFLTSALTAGFVEEFVFLCSPSMTRLGLCQ